MKNKVYKLLLPVLLVTSIGAMNAGELPVKPIAPASTSMDIIGLYKLADTLANNGFESLAISTRDTAKILGDSYLYRTVKMAALVGLLYQAQSLIAESLTKNPSSTDSDLLLKVYFKIVAFASGMYFFMSNFGRRWESRWEKFEPWYDFAEEPNA